MTYTAESLQASVTTGTLWDATLDHMVLRTELGDSGQQLASDTSHSLTRRGLEMRVRVVELEAGCGSAIIVGDPEHHPRPLVRIHSRCLYGDALGSEDCDCGPELELAMDLIQAEGTGVLLYLEQEGRGAGLTVKAQALRLTETKGCTTFESYDELAVARDSRSYGAAAIFLREQLELTELRLLTNNPGKVTSLRKHGLHTDMVRLPTAPTSQRAIRYLESKRQRSRHLLPRSGLWQARIWGVRVGVAAIVVSGVGGSLLLAREVLAVHEFLVFALLFTHPVGRSARMGVMTVRHRLFPRRTRRPRQ
ncbi:GTP cyclohydrolase II RibA [Nocardia sp. CDC160]|uniref:GTP cyclohydrolase II RibA n=1 Tax=Nocardia sp. CDC160 TaxID=3112166 RepID=UPI002DBA7FEF|nr:GTP cyclohydrolase II RibA [Nocardia sp. CDC160]MEC3917393.1 GTP cyclohydrolase II RibA [Nocardia sp. CDC160]